MRSLAISASSVRQLAHLLDDLVPEEDLRLEVRALPDGGLELQQLAVVQTGPPRLWGLVQRVIVDGADHVVLIEREWGRHPETGTWERFPWGRGPGRSTFEGAEHDGWAAAWATALLQQSTFSLAGAANQLGVSVQALHRHIQSGHVRATQRDAEFVQARQWQIRPTDLEAFRAWLEPRRRQFRPRWDWTQGGPPPGWSHRTPRDFLPSDGTEKEASMTAPPPPGRAGTRIISISNHKGGVAKTTTAVNLAAAFARQRRRVLLVDIDPQSNATSVFLTSRFSLGPAEGVATTYEVLLKQATAEEAIQTTALVANERDGFPAATLDLLPAHIRLAKAEQELSGAVRREDRLGAALRTVADRYDYILIDCPPSLALLTQNAFFAAKEVLIPIEPGYFPLLGIRTLQESMAEVAPVTGLRLLGLLPTMQDRTVESQQTLEALEAAFGELVFSAIPRRVAFRDAHGANVDIFGYPGGKSAAAAYLRLAEEVDARGIQ